MEYDEAWTCLAFSGIEPVAVPSFETSGKQTPHLDRGKEMREGEFNTRGEAHKRKGLIMPAIEIQAESLRGARPFRRPRFAFRASLQRQRAALLGLGVAMVVAGWETPGLGQYINRRSSYEKMLLNRLDTSEVSQPEDLPELSRLLLLESISMREHLRRELRGTLAGPRLLEESDALWQAATLLDDVVAGEPVGVTLQEALADLEAAYVRVRDDLGTVPGIARLAAYRLDRVTRLLGEIRPRIGSAGPVGAANASGDLRREFRPQARRLIQQLDDLLGQLKTSDARPGVEQLRALADGFDRLLSSRPTIDDLRAAFRPIRLQALPLNALFLNKPFPAEVRNRWRAIQDGINRLSERFGFPRVIDLTPASPVSRPSSPEALARVDSAVAEIDAFLAETAPDSVQLPDKARVEDEAQRLRTLLFRYRQDLLAGSSAPRLAPTLGDLVSATRQLAARAQTPLVRRQGLDFPRIRTIEKLVSELGQEPSTR
jgi:hypothetical protein